MLKKILGVALGLATFAMPAFAADNLPSGALPALVYGGSGYFAPRAPTVFKNLSATNIASEATVWTPASGKKFRLMGYCLSQDGAQAAVTLKDNTSGTTILVIPKAPAAATAQCQSLGPIGILSATADNVLTATGTTSETLTGYIYGTEE